MLLDVTGHQMNITPALRTYVTDKLGRLERHTDKLNKMHVILSVEKLRHKAEAHMNLPGNSLFADAVDGDMYAAIDALADKLDRQVKKHQQKRVDHHQSEGGLKKQELAD